MAIQQMTVYEALEKQKSLKELIEKRKRAGVIGYYQGIDGEVISGVSREDTAKAMKGNLQSVKALMANYIEIKSKVKTCRDRSSGQ
jgi:hypothetical protein